MDKRDTTFRRNISVRRTHYSKDRAMQSVVRVFNETLNISYKAFKTIYWRLNLRMIMSLSQAHTK